jgi:hypothetical protein
MSSLNNTFNFIFLVEAETSSFEAWNLRGIKLCLFIPLNPILHKLMSQMNNYRVFGSKKERKEEMKLALSSNSDAGGIH